MLNTPPPTTTQATLRRSSILSLLSLLVFFELLPLAAILALRPPPPAPESAPAAEFSATRAARHVRAIAREPHPVGSADHDRVLEYLVGRFAKLGIPTRIHDVESFTVTLPSGQPARLRNLLARIEGNQNGAAVALAAHYDSVPEGPGAADDGAAVAALLETARALKSGSPLQNDVVFIITDGEELGLMGAEGFVQDEHPWVKDIGVVVNFEARGNSGPSILFETSAQNGVLVRELAASLSRPVGNSLAYSIYRLLPNDTDLTVYKRAGLAGVNFAFIDGYRAYHTADDRPENLSLHSLQHHGEHALALARHFGNRPLPLERKTNVVYFDVCGRFLVVYPVAWALPGVLLVFAALVVTLLLSRRGKPLLPDLWPALRAAAWDGFVALGSVSLGLAAVILILRTTGTLASPPPRGEGLGSAFFVLGVWNFVLAVLSLRLERRDTGSAPRLYRFGFLLVWLVPLGLTGLFLAEASYLFVWPGLAGVFAVALAGESTPRRVALRSVAAVLLGLPSILLLVSATYLLFLAAAPDPLLAIVICSVFTTLTLTLLVPQLRLLSPAAPRRVFVLGAVGAVLAFALEFLASRLQ